MRQENSGGCAVPRNTGLIHYEGEFIAFMDANDLLTPDRIERQVKFLLQYPGSSVVFSDYRNFSANRDHPPF